MRKIYEKATNNMYGFVKTNEKVEITFNGWDGKSYDGETRKMNVWTCDNLPGKKFVYVRKTFDRTKADCFMIVTDNMVVEKTTGIAHPEVDYYISFDVKYTLVH